MSPVAARVFNLLIAFSCLFIASTVGTDMDDTLSQCYPVMECNEGTDTNVNRLNYEPSTDSWDSNANLICPRSDSDVSQWLVLFKNSSDPQLYAKLTSGSYCLRNTTTDDNSSTPLDLSPTVICTKDGQLIIQNVPNYEGTSGQMEFTFNSSAEYSYETKFTIRYAPTGVYSELSTVYFSEGDKFAALNWFIYHANPPLVNTFKVYFNERLIKDETTKFDKTKYSYSPVTKCISTSTGVQTLHYSLFVKNPSATLSTGEYVLVVDEYSATITLALNPSPPVVTTTTTAPIPSSSLYSSLVPSSAIFSSPAIGSQRPPGPCPFLTASSITSTGSTSNSNRLHPSSSPPMIMFPDPTSRSSSSFSTGTTIILPVLLGVAFVLVLVGAVSFCVVAFIVKNKSRNNKTDNDIVENAQTSGGVGEEGSSSLAFTPSSGDPTPININRQYSEDPSLYKYHLRRGSKSDRKCSHENIGLENFTLTNDQSLRPTATTTTSFNGPFSRSLSKSSNSSYQMIKPVSNDEAHALKSATSIARTDSSESIEHEGHSYTDKDHVESSYVNASRSSSFASNELIDSDQQQTGTPLQHKRLTELKGGATVVSQSLPATSHLSSTVTSHSDTTPQAQLMSSSVSSLEKEHTHLLRQLLNQAKKKVKIDKQVAMETDRTSREQLAMKKEMVNILQRREEEEGEGSGTDGHIGFYNQMSEVDDDDAMFEMDQDD